MKERIIPRAVLFFLGEVEYDEFSFSECGGEESIDDDGTGDNETFVST